MRILLRILISSLLTVILFQSQILADNCNTLPKVDVHQMRNNLWTEYQPETVEAIAALGELARQQEMVTRMRVVQCVNDRLLAKNLKASKPSGTPPHIEGSVGVLTDIDDTFPDLKSSRAAAKEFQDMGYTVKWDTDNSFSVKEIDYSGFSAEEPKFAPGSIEEENSLRKAFRNEDNVKTIGGQDWVENKVMKGAKIDGLNKEKKALVGKLDDANLTRKQRSSIKQRVANIDDEVTLISKEMRAWRNKDPIGFNTDMMKKGSHHMDMSKWDTPQTNFDAVEQPRQSAKAAQRALSESTANPTPAQKELIERLNAQSKRKRILPSDPEQYKIAEQALKDDIREAFHQASVNAKSQDNEINEQLVKRWRAAKEAGDEASKKQIMKEMDDRALAQRRTAMTMDELAKNDHVPWSSEAVHEWQTGNKVTKIERQGLPPRYQVTGTSADGKTFVRSISQAELDMTQKNIIRRNRIHGNYTGPPFQTKPKFSSYKKSSIEKIIGKVKTAAKSSKVTSALKKMGPMGLIGIGVSAYDGADIVTKKMNKDKMPLPTWDELLSGNASREKVKNWVKATGLGTIYGVADTIGVTTVGTAHAIGGGLYDAAKRIELRNAQQQGRGANKLGVLTNLASPGLLGAELAKSFAEGTADWAKQRLTDMNGAFKAEIDASWAEAISDVKSKALAEQLNQSGLAQLGGQIDTLRQWTQVLRQGYGRASQLISSAIILKDDAQLYSGQLQRLSLNEECSRLVNGMISQPPTMDSKSANSVLLAAKNNNQEQIRQAAKASMQAYGSAIGTDAVLSQPLNGKANLKALADEHKHHQQRLQLRLSRMISVVGEISVLQQYLSEVRTMASPIPTGKIVEIQTAAKEITTEMDRQLNALAKQGELQNRTVCNLPSQQKANKIANSPNPKLAASQFGPEVKERREDGSLATKQTTKTDSEGRSDDETGANKTDGNESSEKETETNLDEDSNENDISWDGVFLPDVVGMNYADAVAAIETVGLVSLPPELGNSASNFDDIGKVEVAIPVVDGQLQLGDQIIIQLYGEPVDSGNVPNVLGMKLDAAADVIILAGFSVAIELGDDTHDETKEGVVARQNPPAGSEIESGGDVTLIVFTLALETQKVPQLTGLSFTDAKRKLKANGLFVTPETDKGAPSEDKVGYVYRQYPESGFEVMSGIAINIWMYSEVTDESRIVQEKVQNKVQRPGVPYINLPGRLGVLTLGEIEEGDLKNNTKYSGSQSSVRIYRSKANNGFLHSRSSEKMRVLSADYDGDGDAIGAGSIYIRWLESSDHKASYIGCSNDSEKGKINYYQKNYAFGIFSSTAYVDIGGRLYYRKIQTPETLRAIKKALYDILKQIEPYAKTCSDNDSVNVKEPGIIYTVPDEAVDKEECSQGILGSAGSCG